jgi:hypothetical protein
VKIPVCLGMRRETGLKMNFDHYYCRAFLQPCEQPGFQDSVCFDPLILQRSHLVLDTVFECILLIGPHVG